VGALSSDVLYDLFLVRMEGHELARVKMAAYWVCGYLFQSEAGDDRRHWDIGVRLSMFTTEKIKARVVDVEGAKADMSANSKVIDVAPPERFLEPLELQGVPQHMTNVDQPLVLLPSRP